MARSDLENGTLASGVSSMLQRQACQKYTRMSLMTATVTHRQLVVMISCLRFGSSAPRNTQYRQPKERMLVSTRNSVDENLRFALCSPASLDPSKSPS